MLQPCALPWGGEPGVSLHGPQGTRVQPSTRQDLMEPGALARQEWLFFSASSRGTEKEPV